MEEGGDTAGIVVFLLLILTEMFFYGFGSAIGSLSLKGLDKNAEGETDKTKRKQRLEDLMEDPTEYVNTVQLVATLLHLILGGMYLKVFQKYIRSGLDTLGLQEMFSFHTETMDLIALIAAVSVLVYILLTFGVLLPKKIAARYAEQWAYVCIQPVYYCVRLLSPLTGLVTLTVRGILRILGIRSNREIGDVTEEEIISMVNEGHEQGVLEASQAEMITNIFEFGDKEARDIMSHRITMVAVEGSMTLQEAVDFMLEANNSRFPVYQENIDHIIGIIHLRDAMRVHAQGSFCTQQVSEIPGLLRKAVFIPETKHINDLFHMMQSTKTQMVIVVDEYGQTAGLVAMEDILEEIVGSIQDEYDEDEAYIEATDNKDEYIIEGKTPLEELEERFGICFREEAFETLNGFMISKLDRIPKEGEEFEVDVDGYRFRILSVEHKMIQSVLVQRLTAAADSKV